MEAFTVKNTHGITWAKLSKQVRLCLDRCTKFHTGEAIREARCPYVPLRIALTVCMI